MPRTIALAHRREVLLSHAAQALRDTLMADLEEIKRHGPLPPGVELLC
jgi:hypothetical protein